MAKKFLFLIVIMALFLSSVKSQSVWKKYTDSFNFYTISYPPNFELREINKAAVFIVTPLANAEDKFQERLKIELSGAPQGMSLDSIGLLIKNQLKTSMKGEIVLDDKIEDVTLNGQTAKKISGSGILRGEEQMVTIAVTVALVKGAMIRLSNMESFGYKMSTLSLSEIREGTLLPLEKVIASLQFK